MDAKYTEAINLLLSKVTDGTPKGVFADESELADLESGVYLNTTDGWIYFWDGTTLSEGICQFHQRIFLYMVMHLNYIKLVPLRKHQFRLSQ